MGEGGFGVLFDPSSTKVRGDILSVSFPSPMPAPTDSSSNFEGLTMVGALLRVLDRFWDEGSEVLDTAAPPTPTLLFLSSFFLVCRFAENEERT